MERLANSWLSFFQLHYYTVLVNYISSLNYTQLKQLWSCLVSTTKGIYKHDILTGVSNRWTGIWNGTMEWKMEWNNERTKLQLTRVTGTAQSRSNYLVYL